MAIVPLWKMMEFVNGKDDIPYILENNPVMFETTRNSSAALISSDLDLDLQKS